jgi:uncharacterized protein YbjT (DUF2867 family)
MSPKDPLVVALGCSGPIAKPVIQGLLDEGVRVRILARSPTSVRARFAGAEVVQGSMSDRSAVSQVLSGADAAFLMTPMGMCNDPSSEVEIAKQTIAGATDAGLKHLVYTSVLHADQPSGVGILQAKYIIEGLIREAGLPHSILRCGSYMEDVFDPRLPLLNRGRFLFPIDPQQRFSYTSQSDIPRFIARELLHRGITLNRPIDFVSPRHHTIHEVEQLLSAAAGFPVRCTPKMPVFYLFYALLPYFRLRRHRFSSVIPLMQHFDSHGYWSDSSELETGFPQFAMTSLGDHLARLFQVSSQ